MTTRVVQFERTIIRQETGYWCGPASAQVALSVRGKRVDEATLARECKTDSDGTDDVGYIERVLDVRMPEGNYLSVYPGGLTIGTPARPANVRRDYFWWDIVRSIDNGFAVVANFVVPPNNRPRGVKGSANPSYGNTKTFHYVTIVGWSDEGNNGRPAVLIADSGFNPNVYWMDFQQCFELIHADGYKGYCFADHPLIYPPPPGVTLPPGVPVREGATPVAIQPPPPPPPKDAPVIVVKQVLTDPFTGAVWSPNRHKRRVAGNPRWIVWHTQEGGRTADGLAAFLAAAANEVSYHSINDDIKTLKIVAETDSPWAAAGANDYAFHHCFAGSYSGWSRDKWLSPDASDGKNEDLQLTRGAHVGAWYADKYGIPVEWIGGAAKPPWGRDGFLGHGDLGAWGGGHHDPYPNFPVNEFLRRVRQFLTGDEEAPLVALPPVRLPGTDPDRYGDWMLVAGDPRNDPERVCAVQQQMHRYSYGQAVKVDGDFGELTREAVRQFQRAVGLYPDGIVGPMTASAIFSDVMAVA